MKTRLLSGLLILAIAITAVIAACRKPPDQQEVSSTPFPLFTLNFNCPNAPDYGDSVICSKWKGPNNDYLIKPRNNPGSGNYFAWPQGMVINANTGEINVSQSETGVRYIIGFVKSGTSDTCLRELVLGGATYVDSIYVLENNDTLATPYFNANPATPTVCDASDDTDYPPNGNNNAGGNDKCEFDDGNDDDNGNGPGDEPPPGQRANDQKVRVRTKGGVINLKKTIEDGAFGPNPQNGDTKEVTVYYRLKDCSNKALQKIKLKLIYYNKKSDIPQELVNEVGSKRNDFFQTRVITPNGKPRPPQIIITHLAD